MIIDEKLHAAFVENVVRTVSTKVQRIMIQKAMKGCSIFNPRDILELLVIVLVVYSIFRTSLLCAVSKP